VSPFYYFLCFDEDDTSLLYTIQNSAFLKENIYQVLKKLIVLHRYSETFASDILLIFGSNHDNIQVIFKIIFLIIFVAIFMVTSMTIFLISRIIFLVEFMIIFPIMSMKIFIIIFIIIIK
jgi:hypothetical protein